jgi:hypothetical protein
MYIGKLQCHFTYHKSHRTALGSNLGMHSTNVVTNDVTYGTAFKKIQECCMRLQNDQNSLHFANILTWWIQILGFTVH